MTEIDDAMTRMEALGYVARIGTNEAGKVIYRTTPAGRRAWWRAIRRNVREALWEEPWRYLTIAVAVLGTDLVAMQLIDWWMTR